MKKTILLIPVAVLAFCMVAVGQRPHINTDSLSLISQISLNELKLAKLQNMVDQATRDKQAAATKAQVSATTSSAAAADLTSAPQDRQLGKDAANKASDAKSDAKKGRKQQQKLDKLNKDINELKGKIADEQIKLNSYTGVNSPVPPMVQPPVTMPVQPVDTTIHP